VQIYDANNNNNDEHERSLQENDYDLDDDYNWDELDPLDILYYSRSCSILQYPHACPDPFHKLKTYRKNKERALAPRHSFQVNASKKAFMVSSWVLVVSGVLMMIGAAIMSRRREERTIHASSSSGLDEADSIMNSWSRSPTKKKKKSLALPKERSDVSVQKDPSQDAVSEETEIETNKSFVSFFQDLFSPVMSAPDAEQQQASSRNNDPPAWLQYKDEEPTQDVVLAPTSPSKKKRFARFFARRKNNKQGDGIDHAGTAEF
jgi:hypothetical protein